MSNSRDQMIAALREIVFPVLRELGFSGSFPHFRRIHPAQIDLLTFQFNRHGGSFVVEIAVCAPEGFTTTWGKHVEPKKVSAHDLHPNQRLRLGSHPPQQTDHWFAYEPERSSIYTDTASALVSLLHSDAVSFWQTHKPS
jgi:hypothetical protein